MIKEEELLICMKKSIDKSVEKKIQNNKEYKKFLGNGFLFDKNIIFNKLYFILNSCIIFFVMLFMGQKNFNMIDYFHIFLLSFLINILGSIKPKKLYLKLLTKKLSQEVYFKEDIDDNFLKKINDFCKEKNISDKFENYIQIEGKTYNDIMNFLLKNRLKNI